MFIIIESNNIYLAVITFSCFKPKYTHSHRLNIVLNRSLAVLYGMVCGCWMSNVLWWQLGFNCEQEHGRIPPLNTFGKEFAWIWVNVYLNVSIITHILLWWIWFVAQKQSCRKSAKKRSECKSTVWAQVEHIYAQAGAIRVWAQGFDWKHFKIWKMWIFSALKLNDHALQ